MQFIYPFNIDLHQWQGPDQFLAVMDAYILFKERSVQIDDAEIDAINRSD
jgi:hypothetical protein